MTKILILLTLVSSFAVAADLDKDFDSLGGNTVLLEKAKAIQGESSVQIVQNRMVERINKWELAPAYENVLGGDPYLKAEGYGLNVHYHINPRFSLGLKSLYMANQLTEEANNLIHDTSATGTGIIPAMDYQKSKNMLSVNWYPIYGKLALLDKGVAQFDVYGNLSAGTVELKSGNTQTISAGMGIGFWWTKHMTSRLEVSYETYEAQDYQSSKQMELSVLGFQVGYIL